MKIRATNGNLIGELASGVLTKTMQFSKHLVRVPLAGVGVDKAAWEKHRASIEFLVARDMESGGTFRITAEEFDALAGERVHPPHGAQLVCPLKHFSVAMPQGRRLILPPGVLLDLPKKEMAGPVASRKKNKHEGQMGLFDE